MMTLGLIWIDPMYFVFVGPAILLALWAQWKVKSAFAEASRIPTRSGLTGAQAAKEILHYQGLDGVGIERADGFLGDHYDPRNNVLRLSPAVHDSNSMAAVGIAAHEAGHAIQKAKGYAPLAVRNALVPLASTGSWASVLIFFAGFMLMQFTAHQNPAGEIVYNPLWETVAIIGICLFGAVVVFQFVNLPVEFNASRRAKALIVEHGMVTEGEMTPINRVLNAAAMTYVAATLSALMTLLYYLWIFMGRRE